MSSVFDNEVRLFGLKRSGNGALLTFFYGLCEEKGLTHHHNTDLRVFGRLKKFSAKGQDYLNVIEHMILWEAEHLLKDDNSEYNEKKKSVADYLNCNTFSERSLNVLLLRSPHNHLSSLMRSKLRDKKRHIQTFGFFWKHYADEALGITNYLGDDKVVVLYDEWFKSRDYRERLSKILGYAYTEKYINLVVRIGSSFDRKRLSGRAQEMEVLDRWKHYSNDSQYLKILNKPFFIDYTRTLFGIDLTGLLKL